MSKTAQQLWEEMDEAKDEHEHAERLFLKATGWEYSSSHPDCCWRWTKEFNGRPYSLGTDEAVQFETRVSGFEWQIED